MCMQCKGLIGCNKNGCTQAAAGRPSVAELLARALETDEKTRFVSPSAWAKPRREVTSRVMATS